MRTVDFFWACAACWAAEEEEERAAAADEAGGPVGKSLAGMLGALPVLPGCSCLDSWRRALLRGGGASPGGLPGEKEEKEEGARVSRDLAGGLCSFSSRSRMVCGGRGAMGGRLGGGGGGAFRPVCVG